MYIHIEYKDKTLKEFGFRAVKHIFRNEWYHFKSENTGENTR